MNNLLARAQKVIPGGVNSPVRAFLSVGGDPVFISQAKGAYIYDYAHKRYIDYVGSWGPMILGHAHPEVIKAVQSTAEKGLSFGAPTQSEVDLAELICQLMPSIEMVRMVNSGTEAAMSAIRLARGFTQRDKIIKFNGCYHGHSDSLLVKAGSGALTLGIPDSAGVPASFAAHTLIAEFNDRQSVEALFNAFPESIAAVLIEPVAGNMNCVLPEKNFLSFLREICDRYQTLLIFDEVMTGFRVSLGGAQEKYQVKPDLTILGKIIGGGLPVGAFGGRREIMHSISPLGPVYQAGTLSGNPVAMSAGLATLKQLQFHNTYETLQLQTQKLLIGLKKIASGAGVNLFTQSAGSLFGFFFTDQKYINSFDQVKRCNIQQYKKFFHGMLAEGVYFAPSAFEAGFLSLAHTDEIIDHTLQAAENVFKKNF